MKNPPKFGGSSGGSAKNRREQHGLLSTPAARHPYEKNESHDQSSSDQHPVLAFKTHKSKTLNEKLHRFRPRFWAE
jgi:hypothetical protein